MVFGGLEKFTLVDYPGKTACALYTIGCNFRCPYCHNPELVDETVETRIDEREVFDFLDSRKKMLEGMVITGGEPTIHGDNLFNFMKNTKEKGFLVKLDSNGTSPDFLERAISEKIVDYIAMDIKAPLQKYEQVAARPVDLEAIQKSVRLIMSSPVDYEFRTTVVKGQLLPEDLEEIGKEIRGAKKYFLQKFVSTKILNPQFLRKVSYTNEEMEKFKEKLSNYVQYCGIR